MLKITLPAIELWDETAERFTDVDAVDLELEHSLVSLSKWESKFQKPFLLKSEKTPSEILEYVYLMILTPNIPKSVLLQISQSILDEINDYIESKQSATTFGEMPKTSGKSETITSELIYYWMASFGIPFECQYWHLNRLFSLIRICNIKNSKPKRMSRNEIAQRNRELNAQRKAQYNTKG